MCTYCCCTVYTLLFTFVQFVLYQQLLLEYSKMFLALCTVYFFLMAKLGTKKRDRMMDGHSALYI